MPDPVIEKKPDELELTEDNAAEIARAEVESERKDRDPGYKPAEVPEETPPSGDEENPPSEEEPEKTPPEGKTEEELLSATDEDLTEEEKVSKQELLTAITEEENRILEAKEEDLSEEDKAKRGVILLERQAKDATAFEDKVKAYAEGKDMSVDDARTALESIGKIEKKYESDPFKLAEANRDLQRLVSKKDEDIKTVREEASRPQPPKSGPQWELAIRERGLTLNGGKVIDWKQAVEMFRGNNEALTENLEDEQVLKLVANGIHTQFEANRQKAAVAMQSKANDKRKSFVSKIPESDKQFSEEISALLKMVPDAVILDDDYDLEPSLRYARGGHYTKEKVDKLVQEAELRGFEKGKAKPKVISGPIGSRPPAKKVATTLSPKDLDSAWQMFPDAADEKEASELYLDVKNHRSKNKGKKE